MGLKPFSKILFKEKRGFNRRVTGRLNNRGLYLALPPYLGSGHPQN